MKTIILTLAILTTLFTSCGVNNIREPEYREIRDIRLVEAGILKTTAGMDLVYFNPNDFGVTLSDARGDVFVDGHWLGKFEVDESVEVKKRSEFVVPALVNVDMIGAIRNHREIWKKKEAHIRIDGRARIRKAGFTKEIPIKYESMQNIEKFRALVTM
jgi:LEA14-like dessication related protein